MKKLLLFFVSAWLTPAAMAWGGFGHDIIVEVAKQNLTQRAAERIAHYMPYDLVKEASWMDVHRYDEPIAYTTHWHSFRYDEEQNYRADLSEPRGDVVKALKIADENLMKYRELTDSAVVMNLRFILHFVGDMHCPTHANPPKTSREKVYINGRPLKRFHYVYDLMPNMVYGKGAKATKVAQQIDNCSKKEYRKIVSGSFVDWANDIAERTHVVYEWNPVGTIILHPETIAWSTPLTHELLRDAGYRTAAVLNRYFDHK